MAEIEIEDAELERLVRELMALTGEDEETAIANAVREALERLESGQPTALSRKE